MSQLGTSQLGEERLGARPPRDQDGRLGRFNLGRVQLGETTPIAVREALASSATATSKQSAIASLTAGAESTTATGTPQQSSIASIVRSAITTSAAATPAEAFRYFRDWEIDGMTVETVTKDGTKRAELTAKRLSLSFEVTRDNLDYWRQYDRTGDLSITTGYGGSFDVVDRAGRAGAVEAVPPTDYQPPFDRADYYVNSYEESQLAADRFEISLTLQRTENRETSFQMADEAGEDWLLEFGVATVALENEQVRRSSAGGSRTGMRVTLPLMLTDDQAAAVAESAAYPDAVVERSVPDGEDFVEDTSGGNQTVTITPPASAEMDTGDYAIQSWRLSFGRFGEARWSVELELREMKS
ncbi:hypothetical protein SAMN06269185_3287 [Natronoarchaeum philippinense]|uniref:Uncharacterized protein n=1 Tax=Natronoarchaeum philippinense TaxID=558529 RepID=A0A285PE99_NATPI|nr:hypothetical protein [Natronoarchaeum philippinense]SNZ18191.1 hypothetical protein SAMN06269185_3287 [Natronoarchaeum philippinense]